MALKPNRKRWDDVLSRVDPTRFEALLAQHYRAEGWSVEHVGAEASGHLYDGGIDLKLRRGDEYVVVQCKRWNACQVPHNDVHELIGVMAGERATGAVVVTCGEFTDAAIRAARRIPNVQLVDGERVRQWIDLPVPEDREERVTPGAWVDALQRRPRRSRPFRRDRAAYVPAIAGTCALAASVAFVLFAQKHTPTVSNGASQNYVSPGYPRSSDATDQTVRPATPARAGYLSAAARPVMQGATEFLRQAQIADVSRPIDHESARAAAKNLHGVRTALWLDRANFVVMVDGEQYRTMAMIDQVCVALEPLGDTLAVVVNVQDVTATKPDAATTISRNCQLAEGQRAFLQGNRQVDVVSREVRKQFKGQQGNK
jgi:hypothetical protein